MIYIVRTGRKDGSSLLYEIAFGYKPSKDDIQKWLVSIKENDKSNKEIDEIISEFNVTNICIPHKGMISKVANMFYFVISTYVVNYKNESNINQNI